MSTREMFIDKSSWTITKFGDVAIQQKVNVNREDTTLTKYVKGEHMSSEDIHLRSWGELQDEYLGPAFIRYFEEGDILYGSRRTYLKKVSIAPFEGITSNTTFVIKANEEKIDKRLLPFLMLSDGFTEHSIMHSKGSVNPYINWKDLAKYEFLLPPKEQQAELAELLWAKDELIETRNISRLNLETLLHSTAADHFREIKGNKLIKLGEICKPKQWKTIPLKELTDEGYSVYGGNGIIGKYSSFNHENSVLAIACRGEYCGNVHLTEPKSYITGNSMCLDDLDNNRMDLEYLYFYLVFSNLRPIISGSAQPQIIKDDTARFKIRLIPKQAQIEFRNRMRILSNNIQVLKTEFSESKKLQKSLINQIF